VVTKKEESEAIKSFCQIPPQLQEFEIILMRKNDPKKPLHKWKEKRFKANDRIVQNHLRRGGGYAIFCDGIAVIDADHPILLEAVKNLPETFTVRTGGGGYHFYYKSDLNRKIILWYGEDEEPEQEPEHLGEIQSGGRAYVIGPGCYSQDTRILTEDGFKTIFELKLTDRIATLNKNGFLEYHYPKRIYIYPYKGKMIHFYGRRMDLLVTPDHRMYVKNRKHKSSEWMFINAKDLIKPDRFVVKKNLKWKGVEKEFIEIEVEKFSRNKEKYDTAISLRERYGWGQRRIAQVIGVSENTISQWIHHNRKPYTRVYAQLRGKTRFKIIPFLRLLGWWLTEGSIVKNKKKNGKITYQISITNRNEENKKEIIKAIKQLGFSPYTCTSRPDIIKFQSRLLYEYFNRLKNGKERSIPREIKELSPKLLQILLEAMIKGDGTESGGRLRYYTTSKKLAEDFIEVALKCSYSVSFYISDRRNDERCNIPHKRPLYNILLSKTPVTRFSNVKEVEYDDIVWCVEVPNGVVLVERNGKICWCGNSPHPSGNRYEIVKDLPLAWLSAKDIEEWIKKHGFRTKKKAYTKKEIEAVFKDSPFHDIPVTDFLYPDNAKSVSDGWQGAHPIHGSTTGWNLHVNTRDNVWYCHRCQSGGGPIEAFAVAEGIIDCSEAGPGCLRGDLFKEVLKRLEEKGYKIPKPKNKKRERKVVIIKNREKFEPSKA